MSRFEIKIVLALLLIAVIPLVASVVLVGQFIRVSDSVTRGQTARLLRPLARAASAYRALFAARKQAFRLEAELLARDAALHEALRQSDPPALHERLHELLTQSQTIGRLEVRRGKQTLAFETASAAFTPTRFRHLVVSVAMTEPGVTLDVRFYTPRAPFDDFNALDRAQQGALEIDKLRDELQVYYRIVFLSIFGALLISATVLGLLVARRTTRRVAVLARATQRVAAGDLETRVTLQTRDEIGDLARSFNEMVQKLKESEGRIRYLEKIGAWQDIARRLAHEIKNPLTPIQLAMQQLHQKYDGADPKFTRMLQDAQEIVTEEVDGLRRLVQAFSAFAKLPNVQPEPLDLNLLVEDFLRSHSELADQATISWQPFDGPCVVPVDRMLIKHVLFNLVENAIQAGHAPSSTVPGASSTPPADHVAEKPEVQIALRVPRESGRMCLEVRDNGPGMTPEVAAHVYDPYFTTKDRGTGLGLAIVKKIVLEHRGTIELSSSLGHGSLFRIYLPASAPPSGPSRS